MKYKIMVDVMETYEVEVEAEGEIQANSEAEFRIANHYRMSKPVTTEIIGKGKKIYEKEKSIVR